jgi:uncharacterized protein YbjT (DUF2867 family)
MTGLTLAVGAAGKFAGYVVPAIVARGATVRGLVRDARAAAAVREEGAAEIAVGDLRDRASVEAALQDVTSVFYVAPAFLPNEAGVGLAFVDAAIAAGVKRIVFSSVIHPVLSGLVNHAAKAPVEEAILDSGLEYTFLHPAVFFQNYARVWPSIVRTGTIAEPWSNETRFSRVDYRDVAEVAAIALTEDRLLYGTFELCAEGWLNRHDVAALAGEALGRKVLPNRIDLSTVGDEDHPIRAMFEHYDRIGLRGNPLTLRAILGRKPRTLRDFFQELADTRVNARSLEGEEA